MEDAGITKSDLRSLMEDARMMMEDAWMTVETASILMMSEEKNMVAKNKLLQDSMLAMTI